MTLSLTTQRTAFTDRMDAAVNLVDETHPVKGRSPLARDARGLAIVVAFGAYENLFRSTTRALLEEALSLRVSNRRLQPGFRLFALAGTAKSMRAASANRLYAQTLPKLLTAAASGSRKCTIDVNAFPDDGSFMKSSQIELWCRIFAVPHPGTFLGATWTSVDAIVGQRNAIAHGDQTPGEIGRMYAEGDIRSLLGAWRAGWLGLVNAVEVLGSSRDFYRSSR